MVLISCCVLVLVASCALRVSRGLDPPHVIVCMLSGYVLFIVNRALLMLVSTHSSVLTANRSPMYVVTEETRLGFTYSRRGILLDPALRDVVDPAEQNCFDWAHNILQGVFQHTLWLLLCAVKSYGIVPEHINEYLQFWEWPHSTKGVTGKYIFKPYINV